MKKLLFLFLATTFLLCGCQLVEQTVPTQTEPIEYEHYFYVETCFCTLGPVKSYGEQPNYLQYTKESREVEVVEEMVGKTKTINGAVYTYSHSSICEMPKNANHPARKEIVWDHYSKLGSSRVAATYFHGTDILRKYSVSTKRNENDKEKSQDELKIIAETFLKHVVPEEILSEYKELSFSKHNESYYDLRYVREFPENQSENVIMVSITSYGVVEFFHGPNLTDYYIDIIEITEDMKNAAYQAAMEILEKCELSNAEILKTSYGYGPLGIMYLNLEVEYDAIDDFGNIVRHKDLFHVNVN